MGTLVKIDMFHRRGVVQDVRNGLRHLLKKRLYCIELLPGFSQLGGGDQVHGIGNLPGILDAFHTA